MTMHIRNLKKSFGTKPLFENFSFSASPSEMIAITGSSGCGKTTLLNIIGLLDFDYEGDYIYHGQQLKQSGDTARSAFLRTKLGYLFQNYALIDHETVYANLNIAFYKQKVKKDDKKKRMIVSLQKVGLDETYLDKKILLLSGGEQQRIAVARLILKQSEIILADEPTGNLDTENERIVMTVLKELAKAGKIVIVVTHNKNILEYFDTVVKLD